MKTTILCVVTLASLGLSASFGAEPPDKAFGDAHFIAYEGAQQSWPTHRHAQVIKDFAVPIYVGLPDKSYTIVGRIYDPRGDSGLGVVGRGLAQGLFPESDRERDCANQAQYRKADAVVLTRNVKIVQALGLKPDEIQKTAPLFNHPDDVVLAVKFK